MKKFLALILALVMSLSLVACGGDDTAETTDDSGDTTESTESALNVGVFYYNYSDAYITTVRNAMDDLLDATPASPSTTLTAPATRPTSWTRSTPPSPTAPTC